MTPQKRPRATANSALVAVLVLPVVFGIAVPVAIAAGDGSEGFIWWGLPIAVVGAITVAITAMAFFRLGRGTLAPWDPPRGLVTTGLFAWSRNPMYVGVLLMVAGWALTFASIAVALYAAALACAFHVRVVTAEEPWAARTFPDEWPAYRSRVRRWIPIPRSRNL